MMMYIMNEDHGEQEDENMNGDDDEDSDDDDDDDDMEDESDEDEEQKNIGSPSPGAKKDMKLRSGKRKRRRSKETTGLTPPDNETKERTAKKSRMAVPTQPTPAADGKASANGKVLNSTTGATPSSESSPAVVPDPRRISYAAKKSSSRRKDAPTDQQDVDDNDNEILDTAPPALETTTAANANATAVNGDVTYKSKTTTITQTEVVVTGTATRDDDEHEELDEQGGRQTTHRTAVLVRLGFMGCLSLLFFVLWPRVANLAAVIVPLDSSMVPQPPPKVQVVVESGGKTVEEVVVVEEIDPPAEEIEAWNTNFMESLERLKNLEQDSTQSSTDLDTKYKKASTYVRGLLTQLQTREEKVKARLQELNELEELLIRNQNDATDWKQVQKMVQKVTGDTLIETSSIPLWKVEEIIDGACGQGEAVAIVEEQMEESVKGPLLTPELLKEKQSELLLRAQMSAEKFINGATASDKIKKWISPLINEGLDRNTDAAAAIAHIPKMGEVSVEVENEGSSLASHSTEEIDIAIQERLEADRADTTGIIDHSSLKNGAQIIFGGKRGTSKSLVDTLPLFNRILQKANLRFYGYGPEAALTPTYPPNALGQCWSFQQTPLKEQLKEKQTYQRNDSVPNDFKRGNFGTLTISLPTPVFVTSVIIEHVPIRFTDLADSAIRSFRVVGYEDSAASTKAWNLGSFEYSLTKNGHSEYLQEFEVATAVFGNDIPALQSISLAVDSNWGHDYSCLYRFRVHGEAEHEES